LGEQAATPAQPEVAARKVWPAQARDQQVVTAAARESSRAQALEKQVATTVQPEEAARQVWSAQPEE